MREFLARDKTDHAFVDVRKSPIDAEGTLALVRAHTTAYVKRAKVVDALSVSLMTDDEVKKHFLGREGTLRAPTLSIGEAITAGYDAATVARLLKT